MPIFQGLDSNGYFYRYGETGKKYYFDSSDPVSENDAYTHAVKQAQAIHARRGY
jgi:hypothetical protein